VKGIQSASSVSGADGDDGSAAEAVMRCMGREVR
jgi:hypothetical protein